MRKRMSRVSELLVLATITALNIVQSCWAGPPPPPSTAPSVPAGSIEVSIATAAAIAGYGYWKSRK